MIKTIRIAFVICLFTTFANSQELTIKKVESKLVTHQGVEFSGKLIEENTDLHMFPKWKNNAIIYTDGNRYMITNINLNVSTNNIETKMRDGKLFVYQASMIDSVKINNRDFKRLGRTFYEVLVDKKDNMFLKKFVSKQLGDLNNRLGTTISRSKKLLKYEYLIKSKDDYTKIELNKKSIYSLFEGKEDDLKRFVNEKNLSFKKEKDLIKILNFMFDKLS